MELTADHLLALELLATSSLKERFYWTGGTLLAAYYFHHRLSYDLDFFTSSPFSFDDIEPWINDFFSKGNFENKQEQRLSNRWEFFLKEQDKEIRIDFVHYNHDKIILHPDREEFHGVYIDSLDDIAANKTLALIDRHEPKDVYDFFFLLTKGNYTVAQLLELINKKFHLNMKEENVWSQALLAAKKLEDLKPLTTSHSDTILGEVNSFISKESAKSIHRFF